MIGYVTLGTNNLEAAAKFYDELLAVIGAMAIGEYMGWMLSFNARQELVFLRLAARVGPERAGELFYQYGFKRVTMDDIALTGEQDIMGSPWIGFNEIVTDCWKEGKGRYAETVCVDSLVATDTLWNGGDWNGRSWSGTSWSGTSWSGLSWSGTSWSGLSWSGLSWSGLSWSGKTWNGLSWSGLSWSGTSWSGTSWSGKNWTSGTLDAGLRWD